MTLRTVNEPHYVLELSNEDLIQLAWFLRSEGNPEKFAPLERANLNWAAAGDARMKWRKAFSTVPFQNPFPVSGGNGGIGYFPA